MRSFRNIVSCLLLTTGVIGSLAARTSSALAVHAEQPAAGCHDHGKKAPVRPPANYACCVAGHGSAIPQASCMPQPLLQVSLNPMPTAASSLAAFRGSENLTVTPGWPPGGTPLRV